jgi:hypothetical protein
LSSAVPSEHPFDKLTVDWREAPRQSRRVRYLDVLVNGTSFREALAEMDLLPFLQAFEGGDEWREFWKTNILEGLERLRGLRPGDVDRDCCSLLVCPECGDQSCGGVCVVLEIGQDVVSWILCTFEGPGLPYCLTPVPEIGPFSFERIAYEGLLSTVALAVESDFDAYEPASRSSPQA